MRHMKKKVTGPKFPDIEVKLIGGDGNVFAVIGGVSRALKRAGLRDAALEFEKAAFSCRSYDAVLQLVLATVEVS